MKLFSEFIVEKDVKKFKVGKANVTITSDKGKFGVYINGDKLDDKYKSAKDAEKTAKEFIKLMGEELEA